jgi:hypothetical protein
VQRSLTTNHSTTGISPERGRDGELGEKKGREGKGEEGRGREGGDGKGREGKGRGGEGRQEERETCRKDDAFITHVAEELIDGPQFLGISSCQPPP